MSRRPRVHLRGGQLRADFDILRRGSFMAVNDQGFRGSRPQHVNATSTRIRRFGAVDDGGNKSMSVNVAMEKAQNQRLGA